jgi:hypothetical protein
MSNHETTLTLRKTLSSFKVCFGDTSSNAVSTGHPEDSMVSSIEHQDSILSDQVEKSIQMFQTRYPESAHLLRIVPPETGLRDYTRAAISTSRPEFGFDIDSWELYTGVETELKLCEGGSVQYGLTYLALIIASSKLVKSPRSIQCTSSLCGHTAGVDRLESLCVRAGELLDKAFFQMKKTAQPTTDWYHLMIALHSDYKEWLRRWQYCGRNCQQRHD